MSIWLERGGWEWLYPSLPVRSFLGCVCAWFCRLISHSIALVSINSCGIRCIHTSVCVCAFHFTHPGAFLPLDLLCEYQIDHVGMTVCFIEFTFPKRIFCMGLSVCITGCLYLTCCLSPRQMDAISQTMFSSSSSWKKMFEFRIKFHWSLFLRVQSTIFHHWFK